tara:strand:- start:442 stop:1728 length:1287 start_codon:yes stop_codon:yes gene_type:complete
MKKEALTFVIFGGTGDLAKRKLAPAFSELIHDGSLKKGSTLIGVSRKEMSDEDYRKLLIASVKDVKEKHHLRDINVRYLAIDFSKSENLKKLAEALPMCEIDGCNRIYYLATSYKLFPDILKGLKKFHLLSRSDKFNRVVFEKPFGENLKSSDALERKIHDVVDEKHVFRIDHYLGKESVQNIVALKFGSKEFTKLMEGDSLQEVEISVDESLGVGNRIEYYDDFGAVKDMIQNHLLQLLALLMMDKPKKMESKYIHDEKVKILKRISFSDVGNSLMGQYKGYASELGRKSKTETFARISLSCSGKCKGVKIFLRTGKRLPKRYGRIVMKFRDPKNKIVINLQPDPDVEVKMYGKKIRNIDLCPDCVFRPNSPDAYEVLIKDVINSDRKLFVRRDEIHEAWRIVDSILSKRKRIPFVVYEDCSEPMKA